MQFLSSYCWGRISDSVGRKPVIIIGTLAASVSMLLLGTSTTYAAAIFARVFGGLLNGVSALPRFTKLNQIKGGLLTFTCTA